MVTAALIILVLLVIKSDSLLLSSGDSRDIRKTRIKANQMVSKLKLIVLFNGDFTGIDTEKANGKSGL